MDASYTPAILYQANFVHMDVVVRKESFKTWFFRHMINIYPMFFGTGGKALYIQHDWKRSTAQLKLNLWTRNYVGTIFGGSQFAAADPFYMLMLYHLMGKNFVVWDKAGSIEFKKPGKKKCIAEFEFTDAEITEIKQQALLNGKYEFKKYVEWIDIDGQVISRIEKVLYVATKEYTHNKNKNLAQQNSQGS